MKTLHIVRERNDQTALKAIEENRRRGAQEVGVLLLHDSVLSTLPEGVDVFACKDDVEARGIDIPCPTMDYAEIVKLLLQYDSVITW